VLYVRGCMRSGTTLLADLLNESREIGIIYEQPFGDVLERIQPLFWYERAVDGLSAKLPFEERARQVSARPYPRRERQAEIAAGIVAASLGKRDLRIVGSKTPGPWKAARLDLVRAAFGTVRYVFIVRNPLGTINSIAARNERYLCGLDPSWTFRDIAEAIGLYREGIALLLSTVAASPDDCYVIGYEELLADPERVLAGLSAFLGVEIPYRPGMVRDTKPPSALSAAEEESVRATFASALDSWSSKRLSGPASRLGSTLDDCVLTPETGRAYRFELAAHDRSMLGAGWSDSERGGTWSDGARAEIWFAVKDPGRYRARIVVAGNGMPWQLPVRCSASVGGVRTTIAIPRLVPQSVDVGPFRLEAGRPHALSLEPGDARFYLKSVSIDRS
jgi:hypothetical protein